MKFRTKTIKNEDGTCTLRVIASLDAEDLARRGIRSASDLAAFDQQSFWKEQFPGLESSAFDAAWERYRRDNPTKI